MANRLIFFLLLCGTISCAGKPASAQTWQDYTNLKAGKTLTTPAAVSALAFSPDSRLLAAGSGNAVQVWNTQDGQLVHTLQGHTTSITAIAFSPDGKFLVSGSKTEGGVLKLWRMPDGELLRTLLHQTGVLAVAVSPDGKAIASAGDNKLVRLWDVASGSVRTTLHGNTRPALSLRFSPDEKYLIAAGGGLGTKAEPLATVMQTTPEEVDEWLYETVGEATRWNLTTDELDGHFAFTNGAPNASIAPNGLTLAVIGPGAVSNVRPLPENALPENALPENALPENGKEATAIANPETAPPPKPVQPPQAPVQTNWLGTALGIWQLPPPGGTGAQGEFSPYFMDSKGSFLSLGRPSTAWSPKGDVLAVANGSRVQMWNGNNGPENTLTLAAPQTANRPAIGALSTVVFSSDGQMLAAGSMTRGVQLWHVP